MTGDWAHAGFRADWESDNGASLTLQGDVYRGNIGRIRASGHDHRTTGPDRRSRRRRQRRQRPRAMPAPARIRHVGPGAARLLRPNASRRPELSSTTSTPFDAELQHRIAVWPGRRLTWGLSDRFTGESESEARGSSRSSQQPRETICSAASCRTSSRSRDSLHLTVGTKLEHNDFSGFELQPSGRIAWDLVTVSTLWAAVSRAVRVPTRLERDIAIDVTDPAANPVARWLGDDVFDSEELLAYEARIPLADRAPLFIDVAAFHNRYNGLVSLEPEFEGRFSSPAQAAPWFPFAIEI